MTSTSTSRGSWMGGYRELLEEEILAAWRSHRIVLVCALFVAVGIVTPVLTRYLAELSRVLAGPDVELGLVETGVADVVDALVRILGQIGVFPAVLLAMGGIAGERERARLGGLLARAAPAAVVLAKLVGVAMVLALATGLGVLAAWLYAALLFGPQPPLAWIQLAVF